MLRLNDMKKRYFVIISFDALGKGDLEVLRELPGFSHLLRSASYCGTVNSVYPSLTYPCHASISTGMFPMNHGVVSNTLLQVNRKSPDWNWTRDRIKADTFYDAAMRNGYTTAALFWPGTAKSRVTFNMPEIFANRPWKNQILVSLLNGTPLYQLEMNRRFGHLRRGISQPWLDDYLQAAALFTLKEKRPNVTMIHFTELDAMRHRFGYDSLEARKALTSYDLKLQKVMALLEEEGMMEETTLFVLGDHDQIPVDKEMHLNSLFKAQGLIRTRNQKITTFDSYVQSQDGSAYVYLNDPEDKVFLEKVRTLLESLARKDDFGIETVYTRKEAIALGANRECSFMLEARRGFVFKDSHWEPLLVKLDANGTGSDHHGLSTHGFSPFKEGYQTLFFATGKGIRKNIPIVTMSLLDEGPTFAHLMGSPLNNTDGRVLNEILEEDLLL